MSEFPFGNADPVDSGTPATRDKRTMVLGGALAVVVLAAGGYLLLSGPSSDETAVAVGTTTVTRARATPTPTVTPVTPTVVAVTSAARNPYKALYIPPVAGADGTAATGATSTATASADPITLVTPATATDPASAVPSATVATYTVTFTAVSPADAGVRTMTWKVSGVSKKIYVGQKFGTSGKLVVLALKASGSSWTAVLQEGTNAPKSVVLGHSLAVGGA